MAIKAKRDWLGIAGLALTVILNIGAWVYSYGRLSERVDELQEQVREIRTVILNSRAEAMK